MCRIIRQYPHIRIAPSDNRPRQLGIQHFGVARGRTAPPEGQAAALALEALVTAVAERGEGLKLGKKSRPRRSARPKPSRGSAALRGGVVPGGRERGKCERGFGFP